MQGNVLGQSGGGFNINGLIEEYTVAAGENISAGDFVKFVEDGARNQKITPGSTNYNVYEISAIKLSDNKIFIAYENDQNSVLCGIVCIINNDFSISTGAETILCSMPSSGKMISAVLLSNNRVFIAHSYNTELYFYGTICSVDGTIITVENGQRMPSTYSNYGKVLCAIEIGNDTVFMVYNGSNNNPYADIYKINTDNTFTNLCGNTRIMAATISGKNIAITKLTDTKLFICTGVNVNSTTVPYGVICDINNNHSTITAGNIGTLTSSGNCGNSICAVAVNENLVFVTFNSGADLSGTLTKITNGNQVNYQQTISFFNSSSSGYNYVLSAVKTDDNIIFVKGAYQDIFKCTIENSAYFSIQKISIILESARQYSIILPFSLRKNKLFVIYQHLKDGVYDFYGNVYGIRAKKINMQNDTITGISLDKANEYETIKIVTPNYEGGN